MVVLAAAVALGACDRSGPPRAEPAGLPPALAAQAGAPEAQARAAIDGFAIPALRRGAPIEIVAGPRGCAGDQIADRYAIDATTFRWRRGEVELGQVPLADAERAALADALARALAVPADAPPAGAYGVVGVTVAGSSPAGAALTEALAGLEARVRAAVVAANPGATVELEVLALADFAAVRLRVDATHVERSIDGRWSTLAPPELAAAPVDVFVAALAAGQPSVAAPVARGTITRPGGAVAVAYADPHWASPLYGLLRPMPR